INDLDIDPDGFQLSIDERLPFIRADAAQLERVFVNLLSNAARYSGGERVSVRAREVSGRVVIRVVDRGPGIPDRDLGRIFEAFYQGVDDPSHTGAGLGLAIVKGFVEANGGTVSVESLPGQGTTFVVEFPLGDAPAEHPAEPASPASAGR
ncbi:MAG: HAMP domain-containing sensor histidine kinase, partial [Solirubrobacterales bacterium]